MTRHELELAESEATYHASSWDLSELVSDDSPQAIGARLDALAAEVEAFAACRSELTLDLEPARLLELVGRLEALISEMAVLGAYGSLSFAADTADEKALAYRNRVEQRLTLLDNQLVFFPLWWKGLAASEAERLLPSTEHPDERHWLQDLRRLAPYALDEPREQLIRLKDNDGIDALVTVYQMLTNRLEFRLEIDGEVQTLTRDALMSHTHSPRPELRQAAYRELFRVYQAEAPVLRQIYVHRARDWEAENVALRGMESPIHARHLANDIPAAAVDTLLEVCHRRREVFQRYFRWKAKQLGSERLSRFDLYAPLGASDRRYAYDEAVELVLSTLHRFHPRFASLAERVFTDGHVDAELRRGKKGGAFCATVLPSQTPWLLLNYTGRVRDVATMAHELGHAVHSLLAADHSILTQHSSLPLAETASVFAEMLLTDRMLQDEESPAVRRELLAAALDDIYATVLRQAWFVRFEREAHAAIAAGRPASELDELYFDDLRHQFGDAVELVEPFRLEWITVPHLFQTPFYCYAYSFGQLLVLALYRRYRETGDEFVPAYLEMLARGGSAPPSEILATVSVDPTDAEFWLGGFAEIERMIDELEGMG